MARKRQIGKTWGFKFCKGLNTKFQIGKKAKPEVSNGQKNHVNTW